MSGELVIEGILLALGTVFGLFLLMACVFALPQYLRDLVRGRGNSLRGMTDAALQRCIESRESQVAAAHARYQEAVMERNRREMERSGVVA